MKELAGSDYVESTDRRTHVHGEDDGEDDSQHKNHIFNTLQADRRVRHPKSNLRLHLRHDRKSPYHHPMATPPPKK